MLMMPLAGCGGPMDFSGELLSFSGEEFATRVRKGAADFGN
jgi:hypothetical protein